MIPVELWDLELREGLLWNAMQDSRLTDALAEAAGHLADGTARTRSGTPIPDESRNFEAVWLAGGHAERVDTDRLADAIERPVWQTADPQAVSAHGAAALAPDAHRLAVVDLGQSHLKGFTADRRTIVPRPWDRLPMREDCTDPLPVARGALRAWVGPALASLEADPDVVIVALPCELHDDPTPGGCSYAGLQDDDDFIPDMLARARWCPDTVWVLNDAELAAAAARQDPRTRGISTLVLTLGFGIGAAVLLP